MAGALLNIVAYGYQNIILNGNPSKTFFKSTYCKYTNFGLQKFRVDYSGLRELRMSEKSVFTFKMPRYGDLLMDTYIVLNIQTIWSPIYETDSEYRPYNFKWVKDLGCMLIKEISIRAGGQILQQYSGDYIRNLIVRDNYNIAKGELDQVLALSYSDSKSLADMNVESVLANVSDEKVKSR